MTLIQKQKWLLFRQDDHGNRYLVDKFASEEDAENAKRELEKYFHKQFYWVTNEADASTR